MKGIRNISIPLMGAGAFLGFVGLFAAIFPQIDNPQIQLIYDSFQTLHPNAALNSVNQFILLVIRSCYLLIALGVGLFGAGLFLNFRFSNDSSAPVRRAVPAGAVSRQPVAHVPPKAAPKPAYQILEDDLPPEWSMGPITAPVTPPPPKPAQESNPFLSYGRGSYAPPAGRRRGPVEVPAPNATFMRPSNEKRPSQAAPPHAAPSTAPVAPSAPPSVPLTPIRSTLSPQPSVPPAVPPPKPAQGSAQGSKIVIRSTMGKKK